MARIGVDSLHGTQAYVLAPKGGLQDLSGVFTQSQRFY
jgi:hypothetical protein